MGLGPGIAGLQLCPAPWCPLSLTPTSLRLHGPLPGLTRFPLAAEPGLPSRWSCPPLLPPPRPFPAGPHPLHHCGEGLLPSLCCPPLVARPQAPPVSGAPAFRARSASRSCFHEGCCVWPLLSPRVPLGTAFGTRQAAVPVVARARASTQAPAAADPQDVSTGPAVKGPPPGRPLLLESRARWRPVAGSRSHQKTHHQQRGQPRQNARGQEAVCVAWLREPRLWPRKAPGSSPALAPSGCEDSILSHQTQVVSWQGARSHDPRGSGG